MKVLTALLLVLVTIEGGWAAPARSLAVNVGEGAVAVEAQAVLLEDVLAEISRVAGIEVYLDSETQRQIRHEPITVAFSAASLEEALRRLLRHRNFIFVYSRAGLAEVRIYVEGKAAVHRLTPSVKRSVTSRASHGTTGPERPREDEPAHLAQLRVEALDHQDPDRRSAALDELAGRADEELALQTALEVLERERHPDVLDSALSLLRDLESVPIQPLLTFAVTDRDAAARVQALELLAERGAHDSRVVRLLRTLGSRERDDEVRDTARSLLEDLRED